MYLVGMCLAVFTLVNNWPTPVIRNFRLLCICTLFVQIQLVEYFLWTHLADPALNEYWSRVGFAVLMSMPFATIYLLKAEVRPRLWALYAAYLLAYVTIGPGADTDFSTEVGANHHLKWNWLCRHPWGWGWLSGFMLPFLFIGETWICVCGYSAMVMAFYYGDRYQTWGSQWCWVSVLGLLIPASRSSVGLRKRWLASRDQCL